MKTSRVNSCNLCFGKLKEISAINLPFSELVYFLWVTMLVVRLGKYDFITVAISLLKSDKLVSTTVDLVSLLVFYTRWICRVFVAI